jgi:hypothetical protein
MRVRFVFGMLIAAGIWAALPVLPTGAGRLAAQKMTGVSNGDSVMGGESARLMTPFETFADKLGLDEKTQLPAVREIFLAASNEAAPAAREVLQLRQRVLNLELSGPAAEEAKAASDAYAAAATKIATVEANTMSKVAALLKPNQKSKIPQAFVVLQGMFQIGAPAGRGRG